MPNSAVAANSPTFYRIARPGDAEVQRREARTAPPVRHAISTALPGMLTVLEAIAAGAAPSAHLRQVAREALAELARV